MRRNVGTTDAMIRITAGLLGLAYGAGRMSRRPHRTPWLLMSLSAMKVAEGVTRFCPMYAAIGMNSTGEKSETGNLMDRIKKSSIQAVMNQVTGGSGLTESKEKEPAAAQMEHRKPALTAEDRKIEEAVREAVSESADAKSAVAGTDRKNRSDHYSHDEHRYPTYS